MNCNSCGNPLDSDDHVYNVNCVASNAEYDQLLAEVHEAQDQYIVDDGQRRYADDVRALNAALYPPANYDESAENSALIDFILLCRRF